MAPAIEVIRQAEGVAMAEIAFHTEVRLLGVRIDEILRLRVTERLEAERQECRRVKVSLPQEHGGCADAAIGVAGGAGKPLLIGRVAQCSQHTRCLGAEGGRTAGAEIAARSGNQSLKDGYRVQVIGVARDPGAAACARKCQLSAGRSIGGVAEEIQSEQRVIVKQPVRGSKYGLAVAAGIPGDADPRLNVVRVGLNALLQSEILITEAGESRRRLEGGWDLHVVTQAIIQRQIRASPPRVLPVESDGNVGERISRAAEALNVVTRNAQSVGLYGGKRCDLLRECLGQAAIDCIRDDVVRGQPAEVIHSAVVHGENRLQGYVVDVSAEFRIVASEGPGEVFVELIALLRALDIGIRLASEIGETGNVDRGIRASGNRGVVKVLQPTPRILEPEIIDLIVADRPGVLNYPGNITIGLSGSARVGVLPEGLVLAAHFNACHRAGADVGPQGQPVRRAQIVIKPERIQAGALKYGKVPS